MGQVDKKHLAMFVTGAAAVTAQVVLVRELIAIFGGNELIYGLIMAIWLLTYAFGAWLGGRLADRITSHLSAFVFTQSITMLLLPAMIFFVRGSRSLFGIQAGVIPGLPAIAQISLAALFPVTLVLGLQFALGSIILNDKGRGIGSAYLLEAAGSFTAGLGLSLVLLNFLNSFALAALLALLLAASIFLLTGPRRAWLLLLIAGLLLITSSYCEKSADRLAWRGFALVSAADSPYGKLAVTKERNETNYFLDGALLFSTADQPLAEEFINLALIMRERPQDVLLIGGGFGGAIGEVLKYPVSRLDYLELDPQVIRLAAPHFPPPAVVHAADGVGFVNQTANRYDLIIIDLPDPYSALLNRYYTREFYQQCRKILRPGGILAFKLSGSADFMGTETRQLNTTIFKTVSQLFNQVTIIPGNNIYFFASDHQLAPDPKKMRPTQFFNAAALRVDLSPDKIKYVRRAIGFDERTRINTNLQPVSYYQALLLWASYFNPAVKYFLYTLLQIPFLCVVAVVILGLLLVRFIRPLRLPVLVAALGFVGMSTQLLIILAFQSRYGYLYQALALLTGAFMAGLALGSYYINRNYGTFGSTGRALLAIITGLALFILFLITGITQFDLPAFIFPLCSIVTGGLIGALFPIAVKVGERSRAGVGRLAGTLYSADLFGSAAAALLVTIFLVPVYGIIATGAISLLILLLVLLFVKNLG